MEVSKRSLTLGREHAGQNITVNGGRHRHSPVTQWRVEHGFSEQPDPSRVCPGRCSFVNVSDNIYLCEACGREHVCDEHCGERVLDTANGLPVCPISGMCFDHQLDAAWEVRHNQFGLLSAAICHSYVDQFQAELLAHLPRVYIT